MTGKDDPNSNQEDKTVVSSDTTRKNIFGTFSEAPPVVVVLMGPPAYVGKQFPLAQIETVIGRSTDAFISIDDRSLSRSHARIIASGLEVSILDLGSTNKTIVNGNMLPPLAPCILKNNDQIKVGNVVLKFLEKGSLEALSNQAMLEKANKDALTGTYSKGFLIERAPETIRRTKALKEELSLIVFDIDFFKKINDGFGHPGGDYVLKELCRIVSSNLIRSNDLFARYGGEEFVIILSGTNLTTAQDIGERIRQTIESSRFNYEGRAIPVTVSVGVSALHANEDDWSVLFKRADTALYTSKQTGRNKVTVLQ